MLMIGEHGADYLRATREASIVEQDTEAYQDKSISPLIVTCLILAWLGGVGAVTAAVWDEPSHFAPADISTSSRVDTPQPKLSFADFVQNGIL